ncbi:transmembrane 53-b [Paramyrothecium foliicola]|nr:transmembrane 53-b [Paramyrothecium foliicola]
MASTKSKAGPLSFMTKVSPYVSVYRPQGGAEASGADDPKLILLMAWMNAATSHVAKYVRVYQELYPSSQILLVRSNMGHVLWQNHVPTPDVRPAVPIIRAALENNGNSSDRTPFLLIHSWSNGGSAMLSHLRAAFDDKLPPHVIIFDSGPGLYSHGHGLKACTMGMSLPVKVVAYPILTVVSIIYVLWYTGRLHPFARWYYSHNKGEGEVRRTYILSDSDTLIHHSLIENHAREAEEKGYTFFGEVNYLDSSPYSGSIFDSQQREVQMYQFMCAPQARWTFIIPA